MTDHTVPVDIHTNQQLSYLLLTEVIRIIDTEAGMVQLLQMGCDAELIDELRHRKTRDLLDLSARIRGLKVVFSPTELRQHLCGIDRQRRDDTLCEYFVRHGASRALVSKLFNRSADEVRKLRELVGGAGGTGRTRLPKEHEIRDEIHHAWYEITGNPQPGDSLRNWLYELHKKFPDYTIATLYSTIREFEDDDVNRKITWK